MPSIDALPATFMRGGTSKGVFFVREQLPLSLRAPSADRDRLFIRLLGSPDPSLRHVAVGALLEIDLAGAREVLRQHLAHETAPEIARRIRQALSEGQ